MAINEGTWTAPNGAKIEWKTKCDDCGLVFRPKACAKCDLVGFMRLTNAVGVRQWYDSGVVRMAKVNREIEALRQATLPEQLELF